MGGDKSRGIYRKSRGISPGARGGGPIQRHRKHRKGNPAYYRCKYMGGLDRGFKDFLVVIWSNSPRFGRNWPILTPTCENGTGNGRHFEFLNCVLLCKQTQMEYSHWPIAAAAGCNNLIGPERRIEYWNWCHILTIPIVGNSNKLLTSFNREAKPNQPPLAWKLFISFILYFVNVTFIVYNMEYQQRSVVDTR